MDVRSRFFILVILSNIGGNSFSEGSVLNPFPYGTIGCLVSDVCGNGEICTNDLLFGSCQNIFSRALNGERKFELGPFEIEKLESEIRRLIEVGFTWKDAYTQCTLQNSLLQFSHGQSFNRRLCEDALLATDWSGDMNGKIARALLQVLETGDQRLPVSEREVEHGLDLLNSHKRDEIVQVHKYFDKSTGQLKRDPYFDVSQTNDLPPYSDYYPLPTEEKQNDGYAYFDSSDRDDMMSDLDPRAVLHPTADLVPMQVNSKLDNVGVDVIQGTPRISRVIQKLALTPDDEQALEGLLEGTILPSDLNVGQQRRLQIFIKGLIKVLENSNRRNDLGNDDILQEQPSLDNLLSKEENFLTGDPSTEVMSDHRIKGDLDDYLLSDQLGSADQNILTEQNLLKAALAKPELLINKKTIAEEDELTQKQNEKDAHSVDPHYIYLQVSKDVTYETASQFVQSLINTLNLPEGMVELKDVLPSHMISLTVRDDPQGKWDAEKIANEAQNANSKLEKSTGISINGAWVGNNENRVEVKQNNRYVVITFILVGSIAGVVLIVVAIYLCKRHTRSKQKLAQIATNGDGNEASKDYQDLCRQRMQGISSEKPEPLHAASRIGSVSESQVRSPSSRSSTSSWSEEPAACNMDISTGHIVLSYMEDHLKNQDRLDREWEAVSSYVADPCSTKVATDQSNMRKNRFADILPYDHSRVILSSNANVCNSDYVNANFITDHDPRNPAYVATQGPLPHTVADFWQMVWEQGSSVIVMLTKLAENGTSLCHRYWPEEGSDLYHIYEVHLVSEHIWCDDYLVRSFYLKNLQTNETRTVTQFHFMTWPELSIPASIKALLDFRRKVNKSFRGRSSPIVVHCSDGCGRTGTYCLIDMVLNKMAKGAKEIDMAATLEHIRDQRMSMVKTKEQFQFSLAAVAEEVHAILKALPQ